MLYWAEGTKSRNTVRLTNADAELMRFFIGFLRHYFTFEDVKVGVRINRYPSELSDSDVCQHWLNVLGLPPDSFKGFWEDKRPRRDYHGRNKWPYGVCSIDLHRTDTVQCIYGSIQYYAGTSALAFGD